MTKGKLRAKNNSAQQPLPIAPWIYINGSCDLSSTTAQAVAAQLISLIPKASLVTKLVGALKLETDTVWLIADNNKRVEAAISTAKEYQRTSIEQGCNFAIVNLCDGTGKKGAFGTNHLELDCKNLEAEAAAKKIFKWLFTVLTVPETLYLISDADMLATDQKSFADFSYCSIANAHRHAPPETIQFVVLIASKPRVGPDQKLKWSVVDKTGTANFYFQYRGPTSQYTWEWVLALKPGDRRVLPRMPMVQIKERKRITIIKTPFRATAAVVSRAGAAIKSVGHGVCWIGDKVRLGPKDAEWVPETDVEDDGTAENAQVDVMEKKFIRIFQENGEKCWDDEKWDDSASTTAGSVVDDEKMAGDLC